MNFAVSCRTCQESYGEFLTLDSEISPTTRLLELLSNCTGLQVYLEDSLPQMLCQTCVDQLLRIDQFLRKARDTDKSLRQMLKEKKRFINVPETRVEETPEVLEFDKKGFVAENLKCNEVITKMKKPNNKETQEDTKEYAPKEEEADETQLLYDMYSKASLDAAEADIFKELEKEVNDFQQEGTMDSQQSYADVERASCESETTEAYVEIIRLKSPIPQLKVQKIIRKSLSKNGERMCKMCHEICPSKAELRKHTELLHHKVVRPQCRNFKCANCDKRFPTTQKLEQHNLVHTKARNFECPVCGRRFATVYRQRDHLKMHTNERNFSCEHCDKAFTTRAHLKMHLQCHNTGRPYACEVCHKSFHQRSVLRAHMSLHEEKTAQCNICQRKFSRTSQLNIHKRLHSGDRPYKCEHCSNTYMQKSHLDRHVGVHLGIRFNCPHCDKVYTKKSTLNTHVQQEHVRNKVYTCHICSTDFDKQKGYYYHMKKHHAIDNTDAKKSNS